MGAVRKNGFTPPREPVHHGHGGRQRITTVSGFMPMVITVARRLGKRYHYANMLPLLQAHQSAFAPLIRALPERERLNRDGLEPAISPEKVLAIYQPYGFDLDASGDP